MAPKLMVKKVYDLLLDVGVFKINLSRRKKCTDLIKAYIFLFEGTRSINMALHSYKFEGGLVETLCSC